jgi:HEAT repeats
MKIISVRDQTVAAREAAANSLGILGREFDLAHGELIAALLKALDDRIWVVRQQAAAALCALGRRAAAEPDVIGRLLRTLDDPNDSVTQWAYRALASMGAEVVGIPAVLAVLIKKIRNCESTEAILSLSGLERSLERHPVILRMLLAIIQFRTHLSAAAVECLVEIGGSILENGDVRTTFLRYFSADESFPYVGSYTIGRGFEAEHWWLLLEAGARLFREPETGTWELRDRRFCEAGDKTYKAYPLRICELEEAVGECERNLGIRHPTTLSCLIQLARKLLAEGHVFKYRERYLDVATRCVASSGSVGVANIPIVREILPELRELGEHQIISALNVKLVEFLSEEHRNDPSTYIRKEALDAFRWGSYERCEEFLRVLELRNYDLASTFCHLARVLIIQDKHAKAREYISLAQKHVDDTQYVAIRILFFEVLFAIMDGGDPEPVMHKLEAAIGDRRARSEWLIDPMLDYLEATNGNMDFQPLRAIARAINDDKKPEYYHVPEIRTIV